MNSLIRSTCRILPNKNLCDSGHSHSRMYEISVFKWRFPNEIKNRLTCIDEYRFNTVKNFNECGIFPSDDREANKYDDTPRGGANGFHIFHKLIGHTENVHKMENNDTSQY